MGSGLEWLRLPATHADSGAQLYVDELREEEAALVESFVPVRG